MGMYHDFDEFNGGKDNWCVDKGIMSYGHFVPRVWSKCSQHNLWYHYNKVLLMGPGWKWCMPCNFQNLY